LAKLKDRPRMLVIMSRRPLAINFFDQLKKAGVKSARLVLGAKNNEYKRFVVYTGGVMRYRPTIQSTNPLQVDGQTGGGAVQHQEDTFA
jgi:choline kinase